MGPKSARSDVTVNQGGTAEVAFRPFQGMEGFFIRQRTGSSPGAPLAGT